MSAIELLKEYLIQTGCEFLTEEPMSKHTTFKIGGKADIFIIPSTEEQAVAAIIRCRELKIPCTVIGNGSNLLVKDGGIEGAVIAFTGKMANITVEDNIIKAQSGALLVSVCRFAAENSLSGMEFAHGIPGSLGGAVIHSLRMKRGTGSKLAFGPYLAAGIWLSALLGDRIISAYLGLFGL